MMRGESYALAIAIIALMISSGCLRIGTFEMSQNDQASDGDATVGSLSAEDVVISVTNLSTDKELYHSADVMNLSITISSSSDLEGVQLTAKGIKNRMNIIQTVNISGGENTFQFIYKLPSCNVCGGISAGRYDIQCEIIHGNTTIRNMTYVELRQ